MYGTEATWPILFYLIVIPAAIQTLLLPFCADSPRYVMEYKGEEASKKGKPHHIMG